MAKRARSLQQPPNFLPAIRCTGAGGPSENELVKGHGEGDRDRPQPAEADKADGGSGPNVPADGQSPDSKPSRLQQALELLTRVLRPKKVRGWKGPRAGRGRGTQGF